MNDVMRDPAFPLVAAFGAAPLDSSGFMDDLKRMLDTYQPLLVLIESFYNFHPADVNAANLFERGPVIDAYHKSVQAGCAGATSMMTDHYRSTGTGKSLDLDSISMAGQAENADSWITRFHRKSPNVPEGEFWLQTAFGSRQWGGTEWHIDWDLGPFNHEVAHHVGEISWDVRPAAEAGGARIDGPAAHETPGGRRDLILAYVDANPATSKTSACEVLAKRHGVHEKNFRVDWEELVTAKLLVQNPDGRVARKFGDSTRMVKAKMWKRSDGKIRVADVVERPDDEE
jgi:hypothetical protein